MSSILDSLPSRTRHDLRGALRVLRFALEALREGERFDGPDGPEQLAALEKAVQTIDEALSTPLPEG